MEPITDHYNGKEALGILWAYYKMPEVNFRLSQRELKYLNLVVIDEWDSLVSPYKKELVTKDKLELLSTMSKGQPIFK